MRRLKLTCVLVDEICVHHYAQFWPSDQVAGEEPPYLRWNLEDLEVVEVEPRVREDSEMDTDRGSEDCGRHRSVNCEVRVVPF